MRLKGYDYSKKGIYFITNVVEGRLCLFGKIIDEMMVLNNAGRMIEKWFLKLEDKFPDIKCQEYVIMPNHYHFLLFQTSDKPVSEWLKSLFSGYVQQINQKYDRRGTLFERSAKPKLVTNDNYLIELIHYIHANPLKHNFVADPIDWKYLSLSDYLDNKTSKLTSLRVISEYFSDCYNYKDSFQEYLESKKFEEDFEKSF